MLGGAVVIELPEGGTDRAAEVSPAGVPASGRSRQLRSGHPAPPSQIPHYQTSHASRRTDPRTGVHIEQLRPLLAQFGVKLAQGTQRLVRPAGDEGPPVVSVA